MLKAKRGPRPGCSICCLEMLVGKNEIDWLAAINPVVHQGKRVAELKLETIQGWNIQMPVLVGPLCLLHFMPGCEVGLERLSHLGIEILDEVEKTERKKLFARDSLGPRTNNKLKKVVDHFKLRLPELPDRFRHAEQQLLQLD